MPTSGTFNQTFTDTHAKYLASKVAADLKRIQRFYQEPTDDRITKYEAELRELIRHGYLDSITYGFKKNGKFIEPTLRYTAIELSGSTDDDPGRVKPNADVKGATFCSFLSYSPKWNSLSKDAQQAFERTLPFQRGGSMEPGIDGYLETDRNYSSGGKSLGRSSVRS